MPERIQRISTSNKHSYKSKQRREKKTKPIATMRHGYISGKIKNHNFTNGNWWKTYFSAISQISQWAKQVHVTYSLVCIHLWACMRQPMYAIHLYHIDDNFCYNNHFQKKKKKQKLRVFFSFVLPLILIYVHSWDCLQIVDRSEYTMI